MTGLIAANTGALLLLFFVVVLCNIAESEAYNHFIFESLIDSWGARLDENCFSLMRYAQVYQS